MSVSEGYTPQGYFSACVAVSRVVTYDSLLSNKSVWKQVLSRSRPSWNLPSWLSCSVLIRPSLATGSVYYFLENKNTISLDYRSLRILVRKSVDLKLLWQKNLSSQMFPTLIFPTVKFGDFSPKIGVLAKCVQFSRIEKFYRRKAWWSMEESDLHGRTHFVRQDFVVIKHSPRNRS